MAHIRRQFTRKRTTEKFISEREPVVIRSSSHDPETYSMKSLTFKLAAAGSPSMGDAEVYFVVTLNKEDIEAICNYVETKKLERRY